MARSQRRSTGVLGPLGLLLVLVLWLITVSGNAPSTNLAAPPASSQPALIQSPIAHVGQTSQPSLVPPVPHLGLRGS